MGEFVSVSTDDHGVATLRVDRPPMNALNDRLWAELGEAAASLAADDAVAAVVIWGGRRIFAAGADIKEMRDMSFQDMSARGVVLQESFRALARLPQVTIAAVNGYALGGGCELALTADFRFAADDAKLGQPEILLGLLPGAGGTQRLPRLVGVSKAKEMVYGGGMYSAQECLAMGLVDEVHPADVVFDRARAAARRYAAGPYALRLAKRAIDDGVELDLDSALRLEATLFAACFATEDRRSGMDSFLEHGPGKATFVRR